MLTGQRSLSLIRRPASASSAASGPARSATPASHSRLTDCSVRGGPQPRAPGRDLHLRTLPLCADRLHISGSHVVLASAAVAAVGSVQVVGLKSTPNRAS